MTIGGYQLNAEKALDIDTMDDMRYFELLVTIMNEKGKKWA